MTAHRHFAALGRLKTRIQGLRSKTTDNGCTEAEALLAAAKVAELLDRYDLSLTDVEIRDARCERREYETYRKKRIPLDDCVGAIANFCDCRVWGAGGSVGDCWISGGSTCLHGLCAISVLTPRNRLHSASVASQSWAPCPLSKHHSCPFEPGPSG